MEHQPDQDNGIKIYSSTSQFAASASDYYLPAGFLDRLIAYLIDLFVVTIGVGLFSAFSEGAIPLKSDHTLGGIFLLYYILGHGLFGRTLGKKFLSLRVVDERTGERSGIGFVLVRETIGRLLSAFFLLGYIWIIFSHEKRGFHDLVSRTKVVNEGAGGTSVFKVLLGGAISMALIGGTSIYILLFTSVPLDAIKEKLELTGVQIDQVSGSLYSGFSLGRLYNSGPKGEIEFKNVHVKYNLSEMFGPKGVVIDQIIVGEGRIVVAPSELVPKGEKEKDRSQRSNPGAGVRPKRNIALHVNNIDIANFSVSEPSGKNVQVERFVLSHIDLSREKVSWDRLYAKSQHLFLNTGAVTVTKSGTLEMKTAASFEVRPGLFDTIKRPIQAQIYAQVLNEEIKSLHLTALDNRLQAAVKNGQVDLQLFDLSPGSYFHTSIPVQRLSLKTTGPLDQVLALKFNGSFYLRDRQVRVHNNQFQPSGSSFSNRFMLNATALALAAVDQKAAFYLIGGDEPSPDRYLADLYYKKPLNQLSNSERRQVVADTQYFDFASLQMQQQAIQSLMGQKMRRPPSQREPAQVRQPQRYRGR